MMKTWIERNLESLRDQYVEHCVHRQESLSHILYLLQSDPCFEIWCEKQYADSYEAFVEEQEAAQDYKTDQVIDERKGG